MGLFLFCLTGLYAQAQPSGKSDKPLNPPPYANQPALGTALPPEGMTPHDSPDLNKSTNEAPKLKVRKKPAKKKKNDS